MINVPTELLRTLVTVVDQRSFTRSAQMLGVTQPAVSAQIKRLQMLLGCDIFDKSAPGVALTQSGELVVRHARQLLSLNDRIVDIASPHGPECLVRIGVPGDLAAELFPRLLADFRLRYPNRSFRVWSGRYNELLRQLREGDLDIMVSVHDMPPAADVAHVWTAPLMWAKNAKLSLDPSLPVPLVSFGEECAAHRVAVASLQAAGLDYELVFNGPSVTGLIAAVAAGLGVTLLSAGRLPRPGIETWEGGPAPIMPSLYCAIHVRAGCGAEYRDLADTLAAALRPSAERVSA
jgi:DNA-binding transcriptional LysR family regulator